MNRLTRLVAVMAAALGITLGAPATLVGSAHAGGDPVSRTWLTCEGLPPTTGTVASFEAFSYIEATQTWRGFITGAIQPCRAPGVNDVLAAVAYDADGSAPGWALAYPESTAFYAYVKVTSNTKAVCAVSSAKDRLDCIRIEWIPQDGGPPRPVTGQHTPVDSSTVALDAKVDLTRVYDLDPGCPTCVND